MFALSYFAKVCLAHAKVRPSVAASYSDGTHFLINWWLTTLFG